MKISSGDVILHQFTYLDTGKKSIEFAIVVGIKYGSIMLMDINFTQLYKCQEIKAVIGHVNSKVLFSTRIKGKDIVDLKPLYQYEVNAIE